LPIPQEEKAVLTDAVKSIEGKLYILYHSLMQVPNKVINLRDYVQIQQKHPEPTGLQEKLNDISNTIGIAKYNSAVLKEHARKTRGVNLLSVNLFFSFDKKRIWGPFSLSIYGVSYGGS
jgi:hypothetical protein